MNTAKNQTKKSGSGYRLTYKTLNNLYQFRLSPIAKLVLIYLTSCFNETHKYVFPKQSKIADNLGVSERSIVRAIQELVNEGLILIECKYVNHYKFTSRIVSECPENLSDDSGQNDSSKRDNLSHHDIEPVTEPFKEPTEIKGGNVLEDEVLRNYAIKHGVKNINAYVAKLKQSGSANNIIKEYRKKQNAGLWGLHKTEILRESVIESKNGGVMPDTCGLWVELGKKYGIK